MYVCLCNGYRDRDIREVAETGVRSAGDAYLVLGEGPCCGTCLPLAQEIVDAVHDGLDAPHNTPAGKSDPSREPLLAAAE